MHDINEGSGDVKGPPLHANCRSACGSACSLSYIVGHGGRGQLAPEAALPPVGHILPLSLEVVHLGNVLVEPAAAEPVPHRQHRVPQPILCFCMVDGARYSQIRFMDHRIMVQSGYRFRS